ncbi:MAG: hypothetical protein ACTSVV_04095 [Promethearchaeota archaeon]
MTQREEILLGIDLIEEQKHLQQFTDPNLTFLNNTIFAGQCGRLLGKLRRQERITNIDLIKLQASDIGIFDERILFKIILPALEHKGLIDIKIQSTGEIKHIDENIKSVDQIAKTIAELWSEQKPSGIEKAVQKSFRECRRIPSLESEIIDITSKQDINEKDTKLALSLSESFKILEQHDEIDNIDEPIYYTPLFSKNNVKKIVNLRRYLDDSKKEQLDKTLKKIENYQSIPLDNLDLSFDELLGYQKIGLIDITSIETTQGRKLDFAFSPSIWNSFSGNDKDEHEHVRALLSCVSFGQVSPTEIDGTRYPIKYPKKYLDALIRRGRTVTPTTMAGIDYLILEREGIIKLEKASSHSDRYYIILLKNDIATKAKNILDMGRVISSEDFKSEVLIQSGDFKNTIQNRITYSNAQVGKIPKKSQILVDNFMKSIRGEKQN